MYTTTACFVTLYLFCIVPLLTKYFENEIKTILNYIEGDQRIIDKQAINTEWEKYDSSSVGLRWFLYLLGVEMPFILINPIYVFIVCNDEYLSKQEFYIMPTPFLGLINSYGLYVMVYTFQAISSFLLAFMINVMVLFSIMVSCELYNAYIDLCINLHHTMYDSISQLKTADQKMKTHSIIIKFNLFQQFSGKVAKIVEQHNLLIR